MMNGSLPGRWLCWVAVGVCSVSTAARAAEDLLREASGQPGLGGWTAYHQPPVGSIDQVWRLADGVLHCKGLPKGYLYTKEAHTNFVLKLDWRWPPKSSPGHGGVLLRMSGDHKIWPQSLEVQLNAGGEGDLIGLNGYRLHGPAERTRVLEHQQFGRLTFVSKTEQRAKPPGEWNELEITARGGTVTVRLNGKVVNEATGCDVVAGPVLLTSEGEPIQFRRIQLEPLAP